MENVYLLNDKKKIRFCKKYSVKFNIIIVFLIIITILQSVSLFYLIIMGNIAKKITFYEFNNTNIIDYLHKFESIIDYLCVNVIRC